MSSRLHLLAVGAVGSLVAALLAAAPGTGTAAAAPATVISPQLLVNPGFEGGLSGWTVVAGTPTVSTYGAVDSVATTAPGPPSRGTKYLSGGTSETSTVQQAIDVSGYADEIQLGQMQLEITGYLGGWSYQSDDVVISASLATGDGIGVCSACPSVRGPDILARNQTTGLFRSVERFPISPLTETIYLNVTLRRFDTGTVNDGYADALSVRLINIDGTTPPPAAPAGSSSELARNGRFDAGPGGTGDAVRAPSWTGGIAVRYDAGGGYPTVADPIPTDHGSNFWSGDPQTFTTAEQWVSVSGWSTILDRGRTQAQFSAYLGGYRGDNDDLLLIANFLDGARNTLSFVTLRGPTAGERYSKTGLWYAAATAVVPTGTRTVKLQLKCARSTGTACDGYVDDVSFRLLNVPPAPVVRSVTPSFIAGGTTRSVSISGTGFVSGAKVGVSGTGVTVSNVAFVSATQLTATIAVASGADVGKRTVTVTNPSTVRGSCTCLNIS